MKILFLFLFCFQSLFSSSFNSIPTCNENIIHKPIYKTDFLKFQCFDSTNKETGDYKELAKGFIDTCGFVFYISRTDNCIPLNDSKKYQCHLTFKRYEMGGEEYENTDVFNVILNKKSEKEMLGMIDLSFKIKTIFEDLKTNVHTVEPVYFECEKQ